MRNRIATGMTALLAVGALAATTAPADAAGATSGHKAGTRSLVTVLGADGTRFDHNWHDFDIVERAVLTVLKAKPHSPVGILAQGDKRLTAFIPTDAAFRRLVHDLTGNWPRTERGTFKAVASVADVNTLETILLYHVVPGVTITAKQAAKANGVALETAAGKKIRVHVHNGVIRLGDRDFDARNARVIPRLTDINKDNRQIAHGITQVLRPINL